jgi:hypothetical protein
MKELYYEYFFSDSDVSVSGLRRLSKALTFYILDSMTFADKTTLGQSAVLGIMWITFLCTNFGAYRLIFPF